MKKTQDMIEINREMKNIDNDNFCHRDSIPGNKELIKILYRQDTQMLNYEHYYIKNLERLGMVVYKNYYKEEREIRREKKNDLMQQKLDVMRFLKMRNIKIEKEIEEFMEDDNVQEVLLKDKVKKETEDFERMLNRNDTKPITSKEEQWQNKINNYFRNVSEEKRGEHIERYKDLLIGGLSVKSDVNDEATRLEDPIIEHNRMVAYMYRSSHLEAILKKKISEDNPMSGHMSIYMEAWRTKEMMRKYLGNKDCFNLECLDTGKYKEGKIRIDPDDAKNYFDAWVIEDSEVNREKLRKIEEYNRLLENKERPNFAKPRITTYVPAESLSYKQIAEAIRKRLEVLFKCGVL
ncbi:hypothetical protein GUITHDRAFT_104140 [Guillardia theta CCMP2712]|uniref:Uncharacterized protein n=1 Tax=Guillardia theta (strain CCMP2712) TaxID=905079 RepID=L1JPG8_GUITC|nr:hypothetical protein GUITHDRAFT_104140 [Guillardia theta CCMP2712]EKX50332.1 hypothetical protein GUITHDRAFT_104140 [Guillardia theta CCMP2712]|eukprot:XP_005837312.1 hypothetical protein GUITHDRAFT_104140 [Guillardia theta CCMP2712]